MPAVRRSAGSAGRTGAGQLGNVSRKNTTSPPPTPAISPKCEIIPSSRPIVAYSALLLVILLKKEINRIQSLLSPIVNSKVTFLRKTAITHIDER